MQLKTFAGRTEAMAALEASWNSAIAGSVRVIDIEGEPGSGRRTLVSRLLEQTSERPLSLRLLFMEGDEGLKVLLRIYAAFYSTLYDDSELRQSVMEHVDILTRESNEPRSSWLQAIRAGMDKPRPETSPSQFQVTIPRQSPYLALVEILSSVAAKHPLVLELGEIDHVLSYTFWTFLAALTDRAAREKLPIQLVLWHRPGTIPENGPVAPPARVEFLNHLPDETLAAKLDLEPLNATEISEILNGQYESNRFPSEFTAFLVEHSEGLPGRLANLLELLEQNDIILKADDDAWILGREMSDLDWEDWLPPVPAEHDALARQVLRVAAMEGKTFTASVIAEHLSLDKDTVDDLLDELEDIVQEVVFHEGVQSWLYEFRSTLVQRYYVDALETSARQELARTIATLLERSYLNRSSEYAFKAARLWYDAGEPKRHQTLMSIAASAERPDVLQMGAEIVKSYPKAPYPASLYKGLHLTLLEKVGPGAPPDVMLQIINDMEAWAEANNDKNVLPWLALHRSRYLSRSGKLDEADSLARQAQKGFSRLGNNVKEAEAMLSQALIAQARGDLGMANEHATRALKKTDFPPIRTQALFIRGVSFKMRGELKPALDVLKEALDLSGKTGQIPIHLDIGTNIAECLLLGGNATESVKLLNQLVDVAKKTKQRLREHSALSLLGKATAAQKDTQKAIDYASQALKLAREMRVRQGEAADLLDLGIFSLVQGQFDESLVYLREGEKLARDLKDKRLLKEMLFHLGMAITSIKDYPRALEVYQEALKLSNELKDLRREGNSLFNVAGIYLHQEEFARARTYLDRAAPLIDKVGTPEEKKALKKAQEQLEIKLN